MKFGIQLSATKCVDRPLSQYEDLEDALYNILADDSENVYLSWNHVPIQVSYKYDLFIMVPDILDMMEAISATSSGERRTTWGSNTFHSVWSMTWSEGVIFVRSQWTSAIGDLAQHLNQRSELTIGCREFLGEWASLLERLIGVLDHARVDLLDHRSAERARILLGSIPERGQFYTKHASV